VDCFGRVVVIKCAVYCDDLPQRTIKVQTRGTRRQFGVLINARSKIVIALAVQ
jgi:hypothetical protein